MAGRVVVRAPDPLSLLAPPLAAPFVEDPWPNETLVAAALGVASGLSGSAVADLGAFTVPAFTAPPFDTAPAFGAGFDLADPSLVVAIRDGFGSGFE